MRRLAGLHTVRGEPGGGATLDARLDDLGKLTLAALSLVEECLQGAVGHDHDAALGRIMHLGEAHVLVAVA
jgi:hypothetical protein